MLNLCRTWALVLALCAPPAGGVMQADRISSLQAGQFRLPGAATALALNQGQIFGVTRAGDLFTLEGGRLRNLQKAFAVGPLTTCRAAVAGISAQGELRTWASGRMSTTTRAGLSPLAPPVCVPEGMVTVSSTGDLVRFRQEGAVWREEQRIRANVMLDARLTLADLKGSGERHVVALTGPDSIRYRHGILGDGAEATGVSIFHHRTLHPLSRLTLPAPAVFEDIEARPVILPGSRTGLVLVRATPDGGAALVVIEQTSEGLLVRSAGPDFGQPNRWLAPVVGGNEVWAVHTPHIGGVLHRYEDMGRFMAVTRMWTGVSNHVIGSRLLSGVRVAPGVLVLPSQDQSRLVVLKCTQTCSVLQEWALGGTLSSNVVWTSTHIAVGDASGHVHVLTREGW